MALELVPALSIAGMAAAMLVSFALPIALFVYSKKKLHAKTAAFFIGCGVFVVMVVLLESLAHKLILGSTGTAITGNPWLFALYGGLMAALFEETGRYVAMRFFVKPLDFDNAFMYGVGHGGIEAMLLIGLTMLSNIVSSVMINSGAMAASLSALDADTAARTAASLSALWQTPSAYYFLGGLERVIAITLHISLSLFVFRAVRYGEKKYLLLAYFLHFLVDAATVLINAYLPLWTVELVTALLTAGTAYLAKRACKNENTPITEEI